MICSKSVRSANSPWEDFYIRENHGFLDYMEKSVSEMREVHFHCPFLWSNYHVVQIFMIIREILCLMYLFSK